MQTCSLFIINHSSIPGKKLQTAKDIERKEREADKQYESDASSTTEQPVNKSKQRSAKLSKQDTSDIEQRLVAIQEAMEMNEIRTEDHLKQLHQEMEKMTRKQGNKVKDEITSVKVENEIVRKQVVRMRRELAEMRIEFGKEIKSIKKKLNKGGTDKESDNSTERNIKTR